jgi:hypothetical protein
MKHIVLALGVLVGLGIGAPAGAQEEPVRAVISAQIEAFKANDLDTAFGYASPTIRGIFGSPENFGAMVRGGYPMVWRPQEVRFLALEQRRGRLWQDVLVRDQGGALHILEYQMQKGEAGWKINGVIVRRAAAGAA